MRRECMINFPSLQISVQICDIDMIIESKYVNTIKHQPRYFLESFGALS